MAESSALTKHSAFIMLHEAFQQVRKQQARVSNSLAKCRVRTLRQAKFGIRPDFFPPFLHQFQIDGSLVSLAGHAADKTLRSRAMSV